MVKAEMIKRSPLRILERSTRGGLGKGHLGIIAAKMGVGKTAVLVHLASDQLFQGKHVIHVSFAANTSHIIDWYEDIFSEISRRYDLEMAMSVHDDIVKNRVIMNFNQAGVNVSQIVGSLKVMIQEGHFAADIVVVDSFDFSRATLEDLGNFKTFAEETGIEIWFSVTLPPEPIQHDEQGYPSLLSPFIDLIDIMILLKPQDGLILLDLVKDHDQKPSPDLHLKLDPKILLIASVDF